MSFKSIVLRRGEAGASMDWTTCDTFCVNSQLQTKLPALFCRGPTLCNSYQKEKGMTWRSFSSRLTVFRNIDSSRIWRVSSIGVASIPIVRGKTNVFRLIPFLLQLMNNDKIKTGRKCSSLLWNPYMYQKLPSCEDVVAVECACVVVYPVEAVVVDVVAVVVVICFVVVAWVVVVLVVVVSGLTSAKEIYLCVIFMYIYLT